MSGAITFGATITGGIQDIAGILPFLGTEQCEEHIGSALTKGYLYAAAAPISIFGSLGVARSGFKTLIACMSGQTWSGARILANMGFEPKGINLSLVMIDKNDKDGRHLAETRLDELVKELHIDPSRVTVSHKCTRWNVTMILLTAFLSSLSMIPYIHLNHRGNNLTHFSQWTFPILRAVGGFLTASMMQIVIERRIDRLAASHLAKSNKSETPGHTSESPGEILDNTNNTEHPPVVDVVHGSKGKARSDANTHNTGTGDVEKGLGVPDASDPASDSRQTEGKPVDLISSQHDTTSARNGTLDCVYFVLLLTGILSSVVGYLGCFSVVQNAKAHTGPLSWLCLEAGLSVVRMVLWGLNPKGDDAPPLKLVLKLDHHSAFLPTCNQDDDLILRQKVLPLTRSNQFLDMITSFAGLVERFTHPDLTLYYTLTHKQADYVRIIVEKGQQRQENAGNLDHQHEFEAGKRILYITLFDHKERTTRVYTRDGTTERFYSTESDVPLINLRHGLLETKLDKEIVGKDDLIAGDPELHSLLQKHYQSIMDQIHFTIGEIHYTTPRSPTYTIVNQWTMKAADTMGAWERSKHKRMLWEYMVERGRMMEAIGSPPTSKRDSLYIEHGQIEAVRQSLDANRGRWIDRYMQLVTNETRDRFEGKTDVIRRVDGESAENGTAVGKAPGSDGGLNVGVEKELINERFLMEKLLVYEAEAWEGLVWNRVKEFMGRNDVPDSAKGRLTGEWRGNCWKRLQANIRAMDTRMERVKAEISALPPSKLQRTMNSRVKDAHDEIRRAWQSIIDRLVDAAHAPSSLPTIGSRFNHDVFQWEQDKRIERNHREMARRLEKELADVEFRIAQGLDRCDQFFSDESLLYCRHSRGKLFSLDCNQLEAPLDFYSRALKGNNDVIHLSFACSSDQQNRCAWFAEMICDVPSVTSIAVRQPRRLPPIQRDAPLFITNENGDFQSLSAFLNNNQSLARTRDTYIFMELEYNGRLTIAVSFVGPSSGNLTLRLQHRAILAYDTRLTILDTSLTLTIPGSLTLDDINLHPIGNTPSQLTFTPGTRNNVILEASHFYYLQDLQLLDEDGKPYRQPRHRDIPTAEIDALRAPGDGEYIDCEPRQEPTSSGRHDPLDDSNSVLNIPRM